MVSEVARGAEGKFVGIGRKLEGIAVTGGTVRLVSVFSYYYHVG